MPVGAVLRAPSVDVVPAEKLLLVEFGALVLRNYVPESALPNKAVGPLVNLLEELADGDLV